MVFKNYKSIFFQKTEIINDIKQLLKSLISYKLKEFIKHSKQQKRRRERFFFFKDKARGEVKAQESRIYTQVNLRLGHFLQELGWCWSEACAHGDFLLLGKLPSWSFSFLEKNISPRSFNLLIVWCQSFHGFLSDAKPGTSQLTSNNQLIAVNIQPNSLTQ